MRTRREVIKTILTGILVLLSGSSRAEVICGKEHPLQPVRCACGKLIDQSGAAVSGAVVLLNRNGAEFATVRTEADGKFLFHDVKAGKYELTVHFDGFRPFQSPIAVKTPVNKCERELVIVMVLPYPDNCGSYVMNR